MSDLAIKPCPFCGDSDPAIDEIEVGIWAICCNDCMSIGPHQDGKQSSAEAIRKWNKRPGDGLPAGIIEALNTGDGIYRP